MWKEHYITFIPSSIKPLVKRTEVRILDSNIIPNYDPPPKKGITGGRFHWLEKIDNISYDYGFYLHNSLDKAVKNVEGLVIFYDDKEIPIDSNYFPTFIWNNVEIPAGETRRVFDVVGQDYSVKQLTKRVEIKIRSFETVE